MFDPQAFIEEKVKEIRDAVGKEKAIVAVSGGVHSSTTYILARWALVHQALGFFFDNGLMREGEPEQVIWSFAKFGYGIRLINCQAEFSNALKGLTDPEQKREAITQTFYAIVLREQAKWHQAPFLIHGTILTDVDETVAGIKRQHNVLAQLGINTEKAFGYTVIEPLAELRKPQVREVAKALGLPGSTYNRMPFPGPALAARIIGRVTLHKVEIVRQATIIVEEELKPLGAFQDIAILHSERVPGMRRGKRDYGWQIEVRSWQTKDAVTAEPAWIPHAMMMGISKRLTSEVPGVVSVVYSYPNKPTSTIEAV